MERLGYTFYPKDFISDPDVMMMSPAERGVYRDLIDLAYMHDNKIKYTLFQLSRYCNCTEKEIEHVLSIKGKKIGDFWSIKSCDKRINKAKVNRENGGKGGRPKKPKDNPNNNPNNNPTETQTERQRERERERESERETELPIVENPKSDFDYNIQRCLESINVAFGKQYRKINDANVKKYKALLKQYEWRDVVNAIKAVKSDKFHIENGYKYATPEFFSRPTTIDKYGFKSEAKPQYTGEDAGLVNHVQNYYTKP